MRRLPVLAVFVVLFTILHAGTTFLVGLAAYSEYRNPGGATIAANVMLSPMRLLPQSFLDRIPDGLNYPLIGFNSFIWAVCIAAIWMLVWNRPIRRAPKQGFPVGTAPQENDMHSN